ncbi:kinase-like domain-containing protein, partial [Baffinella frigidus]
KSLGVGSFGKLYLATDLKTGEEVAVKAETDLGKKTSPLRAEAEVRVLIHLQGGPGIPSVYWVGKRELAGENCNILVMDLLGPDMEDLLEMMRVRKVSLKTGLMLTLQMLECLEHIHGQGVLHRDIKPENFLMGVRDNANKVYLIDYGMA